MTDRRRALGLVLQIVAVLSLAEPLDRLVFGLAWDSAAGDSRLWLLIAVAVAQLVTGWLLVYRPHAARAAAIGYALVAVGGSAWLAYHRMGVAFEADLMGSVTARPWGPLKIVEELGPVVLWPIVVAIAVVRATPGERPESTRRSEAGGALGAYGTMTFTLAVLQLLAAAVVGGNMGGEAVLLAGSAAFDVAIGLLAIRAGRDLVMGVQQGRARISVVTRVAAIGYPIVSIGVYGVLAATESGRDTVLLFLALGAVAAVARLAPILVLRAHAGEIPRSAVTLAAPEPDAATPALGWIALWFATTLAALMPAVVDNAGLVYAAVLLAMIVVSGYVVVTVRSGSPRQMWAGIALAGIAGATLLIAVVLDGWRGMMRSENPLTVVLGMFGVGLVLARLARPSLRGQRGLTSVFE